MNLISNRRLYKGCFKSPEFDSQKYSHIHTHVHRDLHTHTDSHTHTHMYSHTHIM